MLAYEFKLDVISGEDAASAVTETGI